MRFALVDIETTGSHAKGHGITEIAIIISDGKQELERWETLVDPGSPIPMHITRLTGIDDDMVAKAPPFHQIADELREWLGDAVFVAHNVGFDYSFIRGHFEFLGQTWKSPKLCTVRMARKLLPGHGSYSLGNLCRDLDIGNDARHRAMGDCAATLELFHRMMALADAPQTVDRMLDRNQRESWLPQHVQTEDFEKLPAGPGVYRFLDKAGVPLYIGMSHKVKHRVRTHFSGSMSSARRQAFLRDTYRFEAEPTGSTLMARLLEDELIRAHWPIHNRAQKSIPMRTAIVPYTDRLGYERLSMRQQRHTRDAIRCFFKTEDAKAWLHACAREHQLDPELLGLGTDGVPHQRTQTVEFHNQAIESILGTLASTERYAIVERGRHPGEQAVVLIENGSLKGWGFTEQPVHHFEAIEDLVDSKKGSATTDAIIEHAMKEQAAGEATFNIVTPRPVPS
jgi:DNA polymerase III subunit epsilon